MANNHSWNTLKQMKQIPYKTEGRPSTAKKSLLMICRRGKVGVLLVPATIQVDESMLPVSAERVHLGVRRVGIVHLFRVLVYRCMALRAGRDVLRGPSQIGICDEKFSVGA